MRRTLTPVAIALLLLVAALAVPLGATTAVAQDETRDADLTIHQPDYVDGDVQQRTDNGSSVYVAEGERLLIAPNNVDRENITGYGLETDAGSFAKDDDLGLWILDPAGEKGTFDIYWDVDEQTTVEDGNETETVTETVRYEASVRVDGSAGGVYLSSEDHQQLEERAEVGDHAETVVSDLKNRWLPFFDTSGDTTEVLDRAGGTVATIGNPVYIFEEGYIGIHTFAILSIGGSLAVLQYLGAFAWVVRKLRREKHEFEVTESEEGTVAERQLEVEERERLNKLSNMDWFDIFEDDHVARAFREQFGETVLDGWTRLNSMILPANLVRDRVKAMGHAGYVAVVTLDRSVSDADPEGSDAEDDRPEPTVESVRLVRESDLDRESLTDTEAVVSLPDPGADAVCDLETLVETLDWNDETLAEFDFDDAAVDADAIETTIDTLDLETLLEELNTQMHHFDDEEQYGEYLCEFAQHVREHPFTDSDGTPDDLRYTFNNLLQAAQLLEDRFGYPLSEYQVDAFETALDTYDRSARAAAYSDEVSAGAI